MITTPQEPVKLLIENDPVEGSDVIPVTETGVKQNYLAAEDGMEGRDELHQNDDTQRIKSMIQENSIDPILSLWGIDALKVSEVNYIICNNRVEILDKLKNLLRAGARLVYNKVGVIEQKESKKPYWIREIEDDIARLRKIWVKSRIGLKVAGRALNITEKMNWDESIEPRPRNSKRHLKN